MNEYSEDKKAITPLTQDKKVNMINSVKLDKEKNKVKKEENSKRKDTEIKKEKENEKEKEKENLNNINTNLTKMTKITNILSSWDKEDKNKIKYTSNNVKTFITDSLKTEIHDLNRRKNQKSTEKGLELNNLNKLNESIECSKQILNKPLNNNELRRNFFIKNDVSYD